MLCRKFRQTLFAKTTLKNNVHYQCLISSRYFSKRCIFFDSLLAYKLDNRLKMSSIRVVWRDLVVARLWGAWTRSYLVNNVVKRCRRERSVREVFQCFRQTILNPRRTFLLSATAAFKSRDGDDDAPPSCEQSITDEDLEALVSELESVEQLSRSTLFCTTCGKRLVVEKKQPAVRYCACKEPNPAEEAPGGWVPYMEAEDVIIWRKEYKPGQGLFAYKVYGRYKEIKAADFAAVQVDGAYRRVWDAAVASLSVVERQANGVGDQAVLHWEVLWPRLFANRDYVYIRRHKEFDVQSSPQQSVFEPPSEPETEPQREPERPSVHSRAKRKAQEMDAVERSRGPSRDNKAFIIISRSCSHPNVPEMKHAIRVNEYWSHMVVRSLAGANEPGMEFVLTYYDEPAVGGLPSGVATWATGRAAPAYLQRMRKAAAGYKLWTATRPDQDLPDFTPFGSPQEVSFPAQTDPVSVREQDMESSKDGPDMESGTDNKREQTSSSEPEAEQSQEPEPSSPVSPSAVAPASPASPATIDKEKSDVEITKDIVKTIPEVKTENVSLEKKEELQEDAESEKSDEEEAPTNGTWWRYLYPFYYFV